jgi:hypothetical protein
MSGDVLTAPLRVDADLDFSVTVDGAQMCGTLRGAGSELELSLSDPSLLGGSGTAAARALAEQLAEAGVRLTVTADRPLVTLGVPRTSYLQRKVTGSRHIRVASLRAALRLLRLRRTDPRRTPLVPPPSPLPLAPTFLRRPRVPTTTHDPDRGGYPRLVMAPSPHPQPGDRQPAFPLGDLTTIGSDPSCDIVLAGLSPLHAEVRRRIEDDEFYLHPLQAGDSVRANGGVVGAEALLRTGTRVDVGRWTLSYFREEYADHGRPYGGRVGGELGHQRPQPPRDHLLRR